MNAISITGLNAGDFSEIDNCNAPTVLKSTNSCLVTLSFAPTASGSRLAQFTVTDNAPGSPQSVALTGTGLGAPPPAPAITFTPGTLNFSALSPGSTSLPLSVTLTNSGNVFAADGCGGGSTITPSAQKTSIATPSGTSTLVLTPTATNASGKALQLPLIQLTLVVN